MIHFSREQEGFIYSFHRKRAIFTVIDVSTVAAAVVAASVGQGVP